MQTVLASADRRMGRCGWLMGWNYMRIILNINKLEPHSATPNKPDVAGAAYGNISQRPFGMLMSDLLDAAFVIPKQLKGGAHGSSPNCPLGIEQPSGLVSTPSQR